MIASLLHSSAVAGDVSLYIIHVYASTVCRWMVVFFVMLVTRLRWLSPG
jgi:hypothetical protein